MIAHKNTETIKVDDYIHIHVIPSENKEYLDDEKVGKMMLSCEGWNFRLEIIEPSE
jgi:hypothetical protein